MVHGNPNPPKIGSSNQNPKQTKFNFVSNLGFNMFAKVVEVWLLNLGWARDSNSEVSAFYNFLGYQPCLAHQEAWPRSTMLHEATTCSWAWNISQDTVAASPMQHLWKPFTPVASVFKTSPLRRRSQQPHRSKRVQRHCNTKHRDKARTTENEGQEVARVHKTTNRFQDSSNFMENSSKYVHKSSTDMHGRQVQTSSNCWTTVPKTCTKVQNKKQLFELQQQQVMILSCWDVSFDHWSSFWIPLQLHHWIIRVP